MTTLRWLVLILSVGGVSALVAWEIRLRSVQHVDEETAEKLATITDRWHRESSESRYIPERDWPAEIRDLHPISVRVSKDGVFIKLRERFVEDDGVFVLRDDSTFQPSRGTDPSYRLLRGRVYWYEIKG